MGRGRSGFLATNQVTNPQCTNRSRCAIFSRRIAGICRRTESPVREATSSAISPGRSGKDPHRACVQGGADLADRVLPTAPAAIPPAPAGPRTTIERLGSQLIEGVAAEGTRTMFGSPRDAGRPVTLLTKSSNGYTSGLTKLSRAEPDSALFRPPAGYTIIDEKDPFPMTIRFH